MKKIIIMLVILLATIGSAFTADFEEGSTNPTMKWSFSPEVSTNAGFNLDNSAFGLEGVAKIDIEAVLREKADLEFTGEGTNYGYIKVEDFRIRVYADNAVKNDYDNNTNYDKADLLQLSIGSISAKVFLGPAYIDLHTNENDHIGYVASMDDGDLDFTNINYSVISPHWTGAYSGRENAGYASGGDLPLSAGGGKNVNIAAINTTTETIDNSGTNASTSGITLGLELPNIVTIELGASTLFGYKDKQYGYTYNPFALSFLAEIKAVDNLTANLKAATSAGAKRQYTITKTDPTTVNIDWKWNADKKVWESTGAPTANPTSENAGYIDSGIMDEGNPLVAGLLLGYALPMGDKTLTPKLGVEFALENKHKFGGNSAAQSWDNPKEQTIAYEAAFGITYDWKGNGLDADESDHLSMAGGDVKVTDGVSLSAVYGQVPYTDFRFLAAPYIGIKLALWESEDTDKPGMISGLKTGFIANFNIAQGGTTDIKEHIKSAGTDSKEIYSKYEYTYGTRMDVGVGLETSYQIGAIKPYLGAILKMYDLTDAEQKVTVQTVGSPENSIDIADTTRFVNKGDARLKVGFEITKVVSNTTFTVEYQSGNLVKEALTEGDKVALNANANVQEYFKNNPGSVLTDPMNNSNARMGYITAGIKVSF